MSTGTFQRFSLSPNSIICWLALSREHKITSRREKVSEKLESYPGGFEHAHHHAELSQSATHKFVANRNYFSRTLSSRLDFLSCADFFFSFPSKASTEAYKAPLIRKLRERANLLVYVFCTSDDFPFPLASEYHVIVLGQLSHPRLQSSSPPHPSSLRWFLAESFMRPVSFLNYLLFLFVVFSAFFQ